MWIISQDEKRLSDCVEFYLQENKKNRYSVIGCSKNSIGHIIGTYENFEKAKKVLDMIQERIIEIDKTKFFGSKEEVYISNVFQMPYDYEVE